MGDLLQYTSTKPANMLYPTVIVPKAYSPDGKTPKPDAKKSYSINFFYEPDHPDVAGMKAQILASAKEKWPGLNIGEEVKAGRLRMPFTTGDRMIEKRAKKQAAAGKTADTKLDFLKGKIVFKASSDFPIALGVRIKGQGDVDVTEDNKAAHKEAFYNGCLGLWKVSYRSYDAVKEDDKPGVKAYLDMVHSLNSGARLQIGGKSAAETFKGVAGAVTSEDPTGGDTLDDEIPF